MCRSGHGLVWVGTFGGILGSKPYFVYLTHRLLGNFLGFFCGLLIFLKINFLKNSFRNTIRVSKSSDPDQAQHFVGPDLGSNCLQKFSADDTNRQRVHGN